jgi:glutathionylspermidine synthase
MMRTEAERDFDQRLQADPVRGLAAWEQLERALVDRRVLFGSTPLPVCLKPHFVPRSIHDRWVADTEALFAGIEEVGRLLLAEPDLYAELGFPEAARPLIEIDPGYQRLAVVARPDVVWADQRIAIYEINCDSPAMMTFTDVVQDQLRLTFPFSEVGPRYGAQGYSRTRALLDAALATYREWGGTEERPTIGIVDWRGQKTELERECAAAMISELGYPAVACDPRELTIENRKLTCRGRPLDLVFRRVLFPEFISRAEEVAPLLTAYRERLACVLNPLRSFLIGNKSVLALFRRRDVMAKLSADTLRALESVVLPTLMLRDIAPERLIAERGDWVLKGALGYGGHQVKIGSTSDDRSWREAIRAASGPWVVQRFLDPPTYQVPIFDLAHHQLVWENRRANWNPFVFGGRFAGAMTRISEQMVVSITARGALLPSMVVDR